MRILLWIVVGLAGAELGLRWVYLFQGRTPDMWRTVPFSRLGGELAGLWVHDEALGWIPKRSTTSEATREHPKYTIVGDATRSNGPGSIRSVRPILAVGDSFTFGQGVGDGETWPAQLERRVGVQVINGGVFGYGLDQTVLRIPRLLRNEIQQVIVSLIPEDIHRMRFSFLFGLQKPFFSLKGDELLVGNTPVPQSPFPSALVKGIPQFLFNSALVNFGVRRILPEGSVLRSQFATPVVQDEVDEEKVYCALLKRIELSVGGRPVTLLIQSSHDLARGRDTMEKLAACTRGSGFSIVDVIPELESLRTRDWKQYEGLFRGHLTAAGNAWVAERVAASLSTTSALP